MKILILLLSLNLLVFAEFTRTGETVYDSRTGLTWQDDDNVTTERMYWGTAINYCESLDLGGHQDWRMPNINEMLSILDLTKNNPALDDTFQNVGLQANDGTWTSTSRVNNGQGVGAWGVRFQDGLTDFFPYASSRFVRCVRGSVSNEPTVPVLDPDTLRYCQKNPDKCGIQCTKTVIIPLF